MNRLFAQNNCDRRLCNKRITWWNTDAFRSETCHNWIAKRNSYLSTCVVIVTFSSKCYTWCMVMYYGIENGDSDKNLKKKNTGWLKSCFTERPLDYDLYISFAQKYNWRIQEGYQTHHAPPFSQSKLFFAWPLRQDCIDYEYDLECFLYLICPGSGTTCVYCVRAE